MGDAGVNAINPAELRAGIEAAFKSKNASPDQCCLDPDAGAEPGHIQGLNIVSKLGKKKQFL